MNEKVMKRASRLMNEFIEKFGFENPYTIKVAEKYEKVIAEPTKENMVDFFFFVCDYEYDAEKEMNE